MNPLYIFSAIITLCLTNMPVVAAGSDGSENPKKKDNNKDSKDDSTKEKKKKGNKDDKEDDDGEKTKNSAPSMLISLVSVFSLVSTLLC